MKGDLAVQRIPLTHLCPGMVTAKNIFSADGRVLIGADVELTERYIERLAHFKILSVYIRNPYFEDAIPPELIVHAHAASHEFSHGHVHCAACEHEHDSEHCIACSHADENGVEL